MQVLAHRSLSHCIALDLVYTKIVLSRNCGTSDLTAPDIETATDTERTGTFFFLNRNTSDTKHDLWEDKYARSQTQVCVWLL